MARRTAIWIVLLLEFGTAACRGVFAQSTKAELFGLIADPSGLAVPEATIELENTATEVKQTTGSQAPDGRYQFFALSPGFYRLTASEPLPAKAGRLISD